MSDLTAARLRAVLSYDPATGIFTRRQTTCPRLKPGCAAGTTTVYGYVRVQVDGHIYPAHHLAWLHVHGEWPVGILDHANGERSDNRIANLRPATISQNKANSKLRQDNQSGFKGAYLAPNGRWRAQIRCNGKLRSLGRFPTAEQAHAAYAKAAADLFGEFARAA